jgi:hypothetical protein
MNIKLSLFIFFFSVSLCDDPFAFGTAGNLNLAAKANEQKEVISTADGFSNDDLSKAASYAVGEGPTDSSVQSSSDLYTDSNASSAATEAGSQSENGFAVSNVKSELAKDDNALYNTNPKFHKGAQNLPGNDALKPYRTFTVATNLVSKENTSSANRGISSRRKKNVTVTSNRSQNNSDDGASTSNSLSAANGTVNTSKTHTQLKTKSNKRNVSKNDVAAANVKGISAAVVFGSASGKGKGSEASMMSQGDNVGLGFTQQAGSSRADENGASTQGHVKAFYNPNRRAA